MLVDTENGSLVLMGWKSKDAISQAIIEGLDVPENCKFEQLLWGIEEEAGIRSHFPPVKGLHDEEQHSLKLWKNADKWRDKNNI